MIDETKFNMAWSASKKDMQNMAYSPFRTGYIQGFNDASTDPIKTLTDAITSQKHTINRFEQAYYEGYTTAEKLLQVKEHANKLINGYTQAIAILELCNPPKTDV